MRTVQYYVRQVLYSKPVSAQWCEVGGRGLEKAVSVFAVSLQGFRVDLSDPKQTSMAEAVGSSRGLHFWIFLLHVLRIHLGAGVHARPAHSALFSHSPRARRCCFRHATLIAKDRACVRPDPMVLRPQVMAALLRALSTSALQGIVQREPDCCCISLRNTSHGVKILRVSVSWCEV